MPNKTDFDHALQLRLPKPIVADIDDVIATIPQLCCFNRCRFIRNAVRYALDSIVEETRPAKHEQRRTTQNEETAN